MVSRVIEATSPKSHNSASTQGKDSVNECILLVVAVDFTVTSNKGWPVNPQECSTKQAENIRSVATSGLN